MFEDFEVIGAAPGGTTGAAGALVLCLELLELPAETPPVFAADAVPAPAVSNAIPMINAPLVRNNKTTPLSSASGVS
jgi:hypothetical protein